MRSLEVHVVETEADLEEAIEAGLFLPEQARDSECSDCGIEVAHTSGESMFDPFCVVLDDSDRDWIVCIECATPIVEGDFRQATKAPEVYKPPVVYNTNDDEDLDFF